jgi:hippurate hydrolase
MTLLNLDFRAAAAAEQEQTIALRRAIHADPELGLDCARTSQKLKQALAGLPLEIRDSKATSGFVAILRGAQPGRTVLLRGDMDALPIHEETGLDFASGTPGCMHACGHDTHSAMLAAAARILCAQQASLAGTIVFMFQPGEEGYHGARFMIEEGLLDDPAPEAAFALHIFPSMVPAGAVACRVGPLLAATDALSATVRGKGGHAAYPYQAVDPIPVACEIVGALQAYISRRTAFSDPAILSITKIAAGTTYNVIPDKVELLGTLRTLSEGTRAAAREAFERIVRNVAAAHGAEGMTKVDPGYPATVNDARAVRLVSKLASKLFGEGSYVDIPTATMGGEDFAYVLQRIPGAMAFLGVAPPNEDCLTRAPIHNSRMTVHEPWLERGVAMHCAFATEFLANGWD